MGSFEQEGTDKTERWIFRTRNPPSRVSIFTAFRRDETARQVNADFLGNHQKSKRRPRF